MLVLVSFRACQLVLLPLRLFSGKYGNTSNRSINRSHSSAVASLATLPARCPASQRPVELRCSPLLPFSPAPLRPTSRCSPLLHPSTLSPTPTLHRRRSRHRLQLLSAIAAPSSSLCPARPKPAPASAVNAAASFLLIEPAAARFSSPLATRVVADRLNQPRPISHCNNQSNAASTSSPSAQLSTANQPLCADALRCRASQQLWLFRSPHACHCALCSTQADIDSARLPSSHSHHSILRC